MLATLVSEDTASVHVNTKVSNHQSQSTLLSQPLVNGLLACNI